MSFDDQKEDRLIEKEYWKNSGVNPNKDEDIPNVEYSLCQHCYFTDSEYDSSRFDCEFFGFPQKPRKCKCKGFKESEREYNGWDFR